MEPCRRRGRATTSVSPARASWVHVHVATILQHSAIWLHGPLVKAADACPVPGSGVHGQAVREHSDTSSTGGPRTGWAWPGRRSASFCPCVHPVPSLGVPLTTPYPALPCPAAGGRPAIVQPNYGLLSTEAAVHRGATQRLVAELLQRLGVHILSGRPLKARGGAVHLV